MVSFALAWATVVAIKNNKEYDLSLFIGTGFFDLFVITVVGVVAVEAIRGSC